MPFLGRYPVACPPTPLSTLRGACSGGRGRRTRVRVASGRMCCAASAWSDRFYAGDGRGVADETSDGQWKVLLCRQCSIFAANALSLVTRCQLCRRYATFGPAGGSRSDALHCKRHRQVRGGRRIDATDSRGGKGDRNVDPKIRGESGWRKRGEMQRIRGWGRGLDTWKGLHRCSEE